MYWTTSAILIKLTEYVYWILFCKRCKFGAKICYNSRDIEFFLGITFLARPVHPVAGNLLQYTSAKNYENRLTHFKVTSENKVGLLLRQCTDKSSGNLDLLITPPPVGDGVLFSLVSNITRKRLDRFAWNFQGRYGLWSDHGTTWFNFESIRVNGSAGRTSICLLSPAITQTIGINKSVA